jgi:hypothetical protein
MDARYCDEAAKYLGKRFLDYSNRQCIILSDATYLERLDLFSINRNVNSTWVVEMKKVLSNLFESRERFTMTVCIDIRHIKSALEDPEAAKDFKGLVVDGQHRFMALKELCEEDTKYKSYEFWIQTYLVQNDQEIHDLLKNLDKRLTFTAEDTQIVDARLKFIKAFRQLIPDSEQHRRCVTGTCNHSVLRDNIIIEKLKLLGVNEIKSLIEKTAREYKEKFEQAKLNKGALQTTIIGSKQYQLIEWTSGDWIRRMLQ